MNAGTVGGTTDAEVANGGIDATEIAALRARMLRFAALQLRDAAAAEDAVQEALAAALASANRYAGQAQLKTWVFAILRNKIVDSFRERARHPAHTDLNADGELDEPFDHRGTWRREERPTDWGRPEAAFENEQFWRIFEACLTALPENTARVFMMRELIGLETPEICRELAISENNCWVILHRARMRLRRCLQAHWLDTQGGQSC